MNKIYIGLGLAFLGGAALGGGAGYFAAVKKLDALYNEKMEEEISRTKDFYKRVYEKEDIQTTAFKAGVGEAADALREYQGKTIAVDTGTMFVDVPVKSEGLTINEVLGQDIANAVEAMHEFGNEPVEKNVFDEPNLFEIDKESRDPEKPYIIDITEYLDTPDGFEQLDLTYYAGDSILGDDKDEPIPDYNVDILVGRANLMLFGASDPEQPHVLLVRNEKIKTDFEITHSDGKFAHEVAGLQHSDETFQSIRRRSHREE